MAINSLTIVADENIPGLDEYFGDLGTLHKVPGRHLSREQLQGADILLVRSVTVVNQALLEGSSVKFVGTATIGTDHLDINYLETQGICWTNAPGCNANSVVDYVLSVISRFPDVLKQLIDGKAILGIVGLGNVGSRLLERFQALSVECLAYDPLINPKSYSELSSFEEVMSSDVICFHTPLTAEGLYPTYHMLGKQQFNRLKPNSLLVNAGRGGAFDNQALKQFIRARSLQGNSKVKIALDVWEGEPNIDSELMECVDIATPHIAGYSLDGKMAGTQQIYDAFCKYFQWNNTHSISEKQVFELQLTKTQSVVDGLIEAIQAVYDVAEDDRLMRKSVLTGEVASTFDQLRKNYRERREFSCYHIVNSQVCSADLLHALRAVGFVC